MTNQDGDLCSLTIEETFTEDSARFTCRASNPAGSSETSATLNVIGKLFFIDALIFLVNFVQY